MENNKLQHWKHWIYQMWTPAKKKYVLIGDPVDSVQCWCATPLDTGAGREHNHAICRDLLPRDIWWPGEGAGTLWSGMEVGQAAQLKWQMPLRRSHLLESLMLWSAHILENTIKFSIFETESGSASEYQTFSSNSPGRAGEWTPATVVSLPCQTNQFHGSLPAYD